MVVINIYYKYITDLVDSAADLYIKDYFHPYVEAGHKEVTPLRIFYHHRWVQTVHPTVLQYAMLGISEQGRFFRRPTKEDVEKHRIIVATLSTSRDLYNLQLGPGEALGRAVCVLKIT